MIAGSIARRWAKALFLIGEEQNTLIGLVREVQRAADVWAQSEELRNAMTNPMLDIRAREGIWDDIIRKIGASRIGRNFLKLLLEKNRLAELVGIARELQVLADRKDNRVRAEVISAAPIGDDIVTQLKVAIQRNTGKMVVVTKREDPELIGGIVTRVGDLMYDGSVKTQLVRMKEEILRSGN